MHLGGIIVGILSGQLALLDLHINIYCSAGL